MATADCGCILTLYLILCRRCAPPSTNSTPATDEIGTLTKRTSAKTTQQVVLCGLHTCPVTLTTPCGDARGRLRETRASERFVTDLSGCDVYLARGGQSRAPCTGWLAKPARRAAFHPESKS